MEDQDLTGMTADIVSAYVSHNKVNPAELQDLISSVHQALSNVGQPVAPEPDTSELKSRAEIKKSVTHQHLISFIDGKPYKTLKRHLSTNGMTPDEYRARFGLDRDYPMVAPSYSEARSNLAKALGLGSGGRGGGKAAAPKGGRKPKAAASEGA